MGRLDTERQAGERRRHAGYAATEQAKCCGWWQGAASPCRLLSILSFQKILKKYCGEGFHTHGQEVLLGGNLSGPEAKAKGEAFPSEQERCILL